MGWFWLDVPLLAVLFTMWAAACRWPGRPSREALDASDHVVYWIAVGLYLAIAVLAFIPRHTLHAEGVLLTVLLLLGVHVALRLMFAAGEPAPKVADTSAQVAGSERPDR